MNGTMRRLTYYCLYQFDVFPTFNDELDGCPMPYNTHSYGKAAEQQ